eukprot:1154291-Pelagomonas_calceolata.AAC.17
MGGGYGCGSRACQFQHSSCRHEGAAQHCMVPQVGVPGSAQVHLKKHLCTQARSVVHGPLEKVEKGTTKSGAKEMAC